MTHQIAGFELRLPESWHAVPGGLPDVTEWAAEALANTSRRSHLRRAARLTGNAFLGFIPLLLNDIYRCSNRIWFNSQNKKRVSGSPGDADDILF